MDGSYGSAGRLFALALGLLLVYLFVTVVRNILEPKIVGGQIGVHPVVTLAGMFVGAQLFGVLGLFGFPIGLSSLLRHLNESGAIKVFRMAGGKRMSVGMVFGLLGGLALFYTVCR